MSKFSIMGLISDESLVQEIIFKIFHAVSIKRIK
jgi:hypothetical protein